MLVSTLAITLAIDVVAAMDARARSPSLVRYQMLVSARYQMLMESVSFQECHQPILVPTFFVPGQPPRRRRVAGWQTFLGTDPCIDS